MDIPLHFDMFEIGAPGRYTFLLHVDGKPQSAAQLNVRVQEGLVRADERRGFSNAPDPNR